MSDICPTRNVQRIGGGGVLTLDCRGYGTRSLRGIPLASQYGHASHSRRNLRIARRPTLALILTIPKTLNIVYDRGHVRVSALGKHIPISMIDVMKVGITSSARICNARRGTCLFELPWTDLTTMGGAVYTVPESEL